MFDDEYNLIEYNKKRQEKNRIEREISYYRRLSKESEDRMRQIETDMGSLEKFAREQFLMKRANEDIFLFE